MKSEDKYKIDSHKLIYHIRRVNDWMDGKITYPIYIEISPTGSCNHRCTFCGLDFMEYQKRKLVLGVLKDRIVELSKLGVKSIMYGGEGEPLLHRNIAEIIEFTEQNAIDTAVTTNGVVLKQALTEKILSKTKWIKISINAGTAQTYAAIHGTKERDFNTVIKNISYAAEYKDKNKLTCTLGAQIILLPENEGEIELLAKISKDIGLNYLVVKPYSQHTQSKTRFYEKIKYSKYLYLIDKLQNYNSVQFQVIFRLNSMKKWDDHSRRYQKCFALPFWSYIDSGGNVWGCSIYLEVEKFHYGNIYEETFEEIWKGDKRMKSLQFVNEKLDISHCRVNCRMDEINRYLWDLKNPVEHVNFI